MLLLDGQPLRPFLADPDHLLFALRLPIRQLEWPGSIARLRLIQSEATTELETSDARGALPLASALRCGKGAGVLVLQPAMPAEGGTDRIIFLSGDSRPKDAQFGQRLRAALKPYLVDCFDCEGDDSGVLPEEALPLSFKERLAWLTNLVLACPEPRRLVLMGRSSGARIASLVADLAPVRGLVCLGYPFRHPEQPDQPERYSHLPGLQTPTLIIQGVRDPYGGTDVAENYRLSPSTRLVLLETDHGFRGDASIWDRAAREILLFLGHGARPRA